MDYSLESRIWSRAQHAFSQQAFEVLVDVAVSSYLREPGHVGVERMHASQVGTCGLHALRAALDRAGLLRHSEVALSYLSVRSRLRSHVYYVLQQSLIVYGVASDLTLVDQLERDLNL